MVLFSFFSLERVKPYWLSIKTALPAGFILIAERSPPNAPKAPPIDSNLAVPLGISVVRFKISLKFWDWTVKENKISNKVFLSIYNCYLGPLDDPLLLDEELLEIEDLLLLVEGGLYDDLLDEEDEL